MGLMNCIGSLSGRKFKIMPNYAKYVFSPKLAETNVIGVFI